MVRGAKTPIYDEFAQMPRCWDFAQRPSSLDEIFPEHKKLMIELGSGTCYFSRGFAASHSDWNVLATDLKRDRLWKGANHARQQKLENIAFLNINVFELPDLLPDKSVDELWLTFPDPYPKDRQAKHRMNQPKFLEVYAKLLKPDGKFNLKTDDRNFFVDTVENLQKTDWEFEQLSTDTHREYENGEVLIETRYEQEFMAAGIPINYLKARPVKN